MSSDGQGQKMDALTQTERVNSSLPLFFVVVVVLLWSLRIE